MDSKEKEFMKRLLETFMVEAEEHLQILLNGLVEIEKSPVGMVPKELFDKVFREAHSLKGAARAVNHLAIQEICQSLESALSTLRKNGFKLDSASFDILYQAIDLIKKYVPENEKRVEGEESAELNKMIAELNAIAEGSHVPERASRKIPDAAASGEGNGGDPIPEEPYAAADPKHPPIYEQSPEGRARSPVKEQTAEAPVHTEETSPIRETSSASTIRVSTHKLDKLLQQIEEMLTIKITFGQRMEAVEHLLKEFEKWDFYRRRIQKEIQTLKQLTAKQQSGKNCSGYANTFNALTAFFNWQEEHLKGMHGDVVKLKRASSQDYRMSGSIVDSLFEETKEVLMQPCQTLFDAYPRMVRDLSKALGKEVQLEIEGAEIEIDRRILEEMKSPLIHLIRNSIDHGIEGIEKRKAENKPSAGKIIITVTKISGSNVEIAIEDDGGGIDIEKVKQSALKNKVVQAKDLEKMADEEAVMLIFQSGISTSPIVTDISGRGVGLEVVSEKVEKLSGKIEVCTEKNRGTKIKILLPLTLATFRGIHLIVEDQGFIIPTHYLLKVMRLSMESVQMIEGKESILFNGRHIPFARLKDILRLEQVDSAKFEKKFLYVLIIKASEVTLAIEVDKILKEQEIFVKGLGKQLVRVRNIADATVMEWGKVIPILDPNDIVKTVTLGSKSAGFGQKAALKQKKAEKKTILIAEDTVTARMLLKNILDSAGYIVKTAIDGIEAFSLLLQEKIDLLLSDIEMPRMSGFELVEKVRATEKLKNLPIVLCTSLSTKEDKERGIAVGADAYIVKSNFEQSNLIETIQKLL